MRKLLRFTGLFTAVLFWVSCTVDEGVKGYNFTYKLAPVTDVDMPDTLVYNQQYHFGISFEKPTDCYSFSGFDFSQDGPERIVGVINTVRENPSCERYDEQHIETRNLDFLVKRKDYYRFKFWTGTDSLGNPAYLIKKVYVITDE